MARIRIIADAYSQLKHDDPGTAITLCALRRIAKNGEIPTVLVGRKTLINYDALIEYLYSRPSKHDDKLTHCASEIRKIAISS